MLVLLLAVAGATAITFAGVTLARADTLPVRRTGVGRVNGDLVVSVGLQDLFSPEQRSRLTSGFASRVLIRVHLRRERDNRPIAVAMQRAEIVYDLWDEKFRVRITRDAGTDRTFEVPTANGAVSIATTLDRFPLVAVDRLRAEDRYFVAVRGDLNPISQDLLTEMREWLRQPAGPQRRAIPGAADSFLGSFVTVFINPHIDESERQVRFVSQTFPVPSQ